MRSILLALLALASVIVSFAYLINLPADASDRTTGNASMVALVAYFIVAPLLHITGVVFGVIGLSRTGGGKISGVIGIVLNLLLFGLGVLLIVLTGSSLTAFR